MTITQLNCGHADLFCCRCVDLGIPTSTILIGDTYKLIQYGHNVKVCCEDCFERLEEEIDEIEQT